MDETEKEAALSRKRKEKSETEKSEINPEKKAKNFSCWTFRRELKGSETLKSLKQFIAAAKNSDDIVFEYLENGGSLQEILSLIDVTASGDLTTALPVFEVVHLILLRFHLSDSKYHEQCIEGAKIILLSHMCIIKSMLAMNVAKQKKVALKVLAAIVTLDSFFAHEVMNIMALSPTLITDLIQPSPEKESVRKCFIFFVLSFLVEGNVIVVKNLLEKNGFLNSIIPGLKFDEASTVNLTLSLFEDKILKNTKIHKTLKLKVFNTQIIKSLFDLYNWKGLQGVKQLLPKKKNKIKEIEVDISEKEVVTESVHSFLLLLCCSQKHGVAFYDKSMGTSEQLNNQLLLTVFESLSNPLKNKKIAEVLLKTTASCPDLIKPILLKFEPCFQPRNSTNWFKAMEFAENLLDTVNAAVLVKSEAECLTANQIIKVGKTLCAPVVFLRAAELGSQKSQPIEIKLPSLRLLNKIWSEIQNLCAVFQNFQNDLKKSLYKHVSKFLPNAENLVELWYILCDPEFFTHLPFSQEKRILFLSSVLESLHIVVECNKDALSSPLSLVSDLLHRVELIKQSMNEREFNDIEVKIVKFVEIELGALTPSTELFEKSLLIFLRTTDDSSLSYLSRIFANLEIFAKNKGEVDVWLLSYVSLPQEFRSSVANYLIESVRLFSYNISEIRDKANALKIDSKDTFGLTDYNGGAVEESPTPLLFNCVEMLQSRSMKAHRKDPEFLPLRHYLNDVAIHLQHFYGIDVQLYDYLKDFNKVFSKSTMNYLKTWKNRALESVECLSNLSNVFFCPLEFNLASWLLNADDELERLEEILNVENTNPLKLYSLFKTVVAYLIIKTVSEDFSNNDVEKFVKVLTLLLGHATEDDRENVDLISCDLKNKAVYQRHCLNCLFTNKHLLKGFDIFKKRKSGVFTTTAIVFKVLMEKEVFKSFNIKKRLSESWKFKFLGQLKTKLKKNKSIDGAFNLQKVLNFFEYDYPEAAEMVELLTSVSDLNLFVSENSASAWIVILTKFIKICCQKEELNSEIVKKLCLITKHLSERCSNLEEMINCFVYLLRKHPGQLLLIENEFLDVILLSASAASTLGKLLLNDPSKVRYFFRFIKEKLDTLEDPQTVFSLLSTLIVDEDSFSNIVKDKSARSVWTFSEISPVATPELFHILKVVYKKFEKNILRTMLGTADETVFKNLAFTRELVKLFLDKKHVIKMEKEILKGKFEPMLLFEAVRIMNVSTFTDRYVQGLLTFLCKVIRSKDAEEKVVWSTYCGIVSSVIKLHADYSWQTVVNSPEWKEFARLILGHCLSSMKHPSLVKILRLLVTAFYKCDKEFKDCSLIFQMVISHSQFLKVMLSESPLKSELVELFHCLIKRCPSEVSLKHVPILLAAYNASLSPCAKQLLQILSFYEKSGVGISDYEPFVWGKNAISHYSIGTSPGLSLWQRFNMGNVLDLLDGQRLELSLKEFPIDRSVEADPNSGWDANVYDPAFLLPLFVNLLSPGSVVFCLPFIYKGGLAYTVRALSSECKDFRLMASVVLLRFYNHLELNQNMKQKLVWMHFINCFRFGIQDLSAQSLPNITTLFFARMTLELTRQSAEMYLPLRNFLLAKSYFSFDTIPEFLPLFHSSEVSYWKHRVWLLEVIRDGTKTASDINIIFHSMALKVVFCFFYSQLCDTETRKLILQVLERMLRVDKSILLITEYGLLNWITSIDSSTFQAILPDLLSLLFTLTKKILKSIETDKSRRSNFSNLIQILNMTLVLLPSLKTLKSVESFKIYLKILNECFVTLITENKTDWFKLNKNKLADIIDTGIIILGENYDYSKFSKVPFYFRDFDEECSLDDFKNSVFLFTKLVNIENKNMTL